VKDCSTWILAEKQPNNALPPRFFPYEDMWMRLGEGMEEGLAVLYTQFLC